MLFSTFIFFFVLGFGRSLNLGGGGNVMLNATIFLASSFPDDVGSLISFSFRRAFSVYSARQCPSLILSTDADRDKAVGAFRDQPSRGCGIPTQMRQRSS